MDIEDKITKLEALIAKTTHEGERESALLARDRLLKKRKRKSRYKKNGKRPPRPDSSPKDPDAIDPFFFREDVCFRSSIDEKNATQKQKDYIRFLVQRGSLSCPTDKLDRFLDQMGLKQASHTIDLLLEMFGEPKNDSLTDSQYYFLLNRKELFGLSEEVIAHLTVEEASVVIDAVKIIQEKSRV